MASKISVIVPVYNAEKFLHRCINSILAQTFSDWELLLIDDGSMDRSGQICDEYAAKDERIRVFHKENGGVSSARNLGLDHAEGEWIAFVDSDDWIDSEYLTCFVENTKGDIVVSGMRFFSPKDSIEFGVDFFGNTADAIICLSENRILGYVPNKLFKKSVISHNNLRFDKEIVFKEDEDFVLKYMAVSHSVVCVKSAYYNYECPDLSKKYLWVDNFWTNLSLFTSVKQMIPNTESLYRFYKDSVVNAFFSGFPTSFCSFGDRLKRLNSLSKVMKDEFHTMKGLSRVSRFFMQYPSIVSVIFFQVKGYLWRAKKSVIGIDK